MKHFACRSRSIAGACALAAASALMAAPAAAQETIATYFAALGPQDYVNSRGVRLSDFGAILQQDRANYHRFGRADPQDQGDAYFGDRANRAMIPALFTAGDNGWWASRVTPPRSAPVDADILVFLCGSGGVITHLIVNHANGDGYNTCEGPEFAGQ